MQPKHNGFVLLIVLVYLNLFTLLSVTGSAQIGLLQKQIKLQRQHGQLQQQALAVLSILDNADLHDCERGYYSYSFLQIQRHVWWQEHACASYADGKIIYYLQEDLGIDHCAAVNDEQRAAHYYRHTLYYPEGYSLVVQDVIARADISIPDCQATARKINSGRQNIRWLT